MQAARLILIPVLLLCGCVNLSLSVNLLNRGATQQTVGGGQSPVIAGAINAGGSDGVSLPLTAMSIGESSRFQKGFTFAASVNVLNRGVTQHTAGVNQSPAVSAKVDAEGDLDLSLPVVTIPVPEEPQ